MPSGEEPRIKGRSEPASTHIPSLALLRSVAAISVMIFHVLPGSLFQHVPALGAAKEKGHLGLDLFFFISGFIIPYSMFINGYSIKHFPRYLLKRSCRLEPPYIASFLLMILALCLHSRNWDEPYVIDWARFFLHFAYLYEAFGKEPYIVVYWTLLVELQFYLLMGLLYQPAMRRGSAVPLALLVIWSGLCSLVPSPHSHLIIGFGFHFLAGIVVFMYRTGHINRAAFLVLLSATLLQMYFLNGLEVVLTVLLGTLAVLFVNKEWRLTNFLGAISYSLYLTHTESTGWLKIYIRDTIRDEHLLHAILLLFAIAFATAFYYLFEKPALRLSKRIRYGGRRRSPEGPLRPAAELGAS